MPAAEEAGESRVRLIVTDEAGDLQALLDLHLNLLVCFSAQQGRQSFLHIFDMLFHGNSYFVLCFFQGEAEELGVLKFAHVCVLLTLALNHLSFGLGLQHQCCDL